MRVNGFSDIPERRANARRRIEDVIAEQGVYVSTTSGVSMYPMLRNRRDTIVVSPCSGRLKKHDVPLYKRRDDYVLHRIIKVLPDSYVIRGDNCAYSERGITDRDIVGVLTGFYRGDRYVDLNAFSYRLYVRLCRISYPLRFVYYSIKSLAVRLVNAIKPTR